MIDLGEGEFVVSGWELQNNHYCITNLGRTFKMIWPDRIYDERGWKWEQIIGTKYYKPKQNGA